ncbi:hypothetical protein BHM03_00005607 [Ensete ventricosum]|nr:hypothetical protein BHM03_00005607 [Ensete ventricosum]
MLCINLTQQKNRDVLNPVCRHKRADYGLPEDKFIFACFNQLYKMDPDIFNTWYFHASNSFFYHMLCFLLTVSLNRCNILKRVPNSALWLLRFPAAGETRLRAYAAAQGVKPDQIIFTDVAVKNEHIRRSALADLFLDTSVLNLERAYFKMWYLYCSGNHPQPFKVTENDNEFPYDR